MNCKGLAVKLFRQIPGGIRFLEDRRFRVIVKAVFSLIFNLFFVCYNAILGVMSHSLIFAASGVYYLLLSCTRFFVVIRERKTGKDKDNEVIAVVGIMLMILSIIFHMMILISMTKQTATVHGTIPMITIATYTFTKITMAVTDAVRHRKHSPKLVRAVNAIRYSEVAVSLLTMQQSMLASFGEAGDSNAVILNACTGAGVCLFILTLGIITLQSRKEKAMAKSKLVKTGEQVAKTVTDTYQKIEDSVVEGYKKVENTVVEGYSKIEDQFVDKYLTKDGETVEEAKARLKNQNK